MIILLVTLILSIIFYDIDYNKCNKGNLILFIHHYIDIFNHIGWLSNNRTILLIYLFTPILILIHWLTNHNLCILTEIHNKICNNKIDKPFNNIFHYLNIDTTTHVMILILFIFITIVKLIL